jgi:hypothetical protein
MLIKSFLNDYFLKNDAKIAEYSHKLNQLSQTTPIDLLSIIKKTFDANLFIDGNCGNLAFLLYLLFSDNDSHFIITLEKDDYCVNEEHNVVDEFKNLESMFYLSRMAGFHHVMFSTGKTLYDINGSFDNEQEALKEMAQGDKAFNNHNFNSIVFKPEETMTPINILTAVTCGTMQTMKIEEIIDGVFHNFQ